MTTEHFQYETATPAIGQVDHANGHDLVVVLLLNRSGEAVASIDFSPEVARMIAAEMTAFANQIDAMRGGVS
jgi:hypothetical protein